MEDSSNTEFNFEIRKPLNDVPLVDSKSLPEVDIREKDGEYTFKVRPPVEPPKSKGLKIVDSMENATGQLVAAGGGAAAGVISKTGEIRKLADMLISRGVPPEQAVALSTQVVTQASMRPGAQPSGAMSAQIQVPGKMMSGDKWAAAIGGPGGDTTQQAVENYHMRNKLAPGETLLRSGIALPPGSNVPGSTIPAVIKEEALAQAAREAATTKPPSRARVVGNWAATTPGIFGKLLGGLGGAAAGYQGYEAFRDMKAAETTPEKLQAIYDMIAAAGSGATALPIPGAQLPGLALGLGIPALGYIGRKISGALPNFGIDEEAGRNAAATVVPRQR